MVFPANTNPQAPHCICKRKMIELVNEMYMFCIIRDCAKTTFSRAIKIDLIMIKGGFHNKNCFSLIGEVR